MTKEEKAKILAHVRAVEIMAKGRMDTIRQACKRHESHQELAERLDGLEDDLSSNFKDVYNLLR